MCKQMKKKKNFWRKKEKERKKKKPKMVSGFFQMPSSMCNLHLYFNLHVCLHFRPCVHAQCIPSYLQLWPLAYVVWLLNKPYKIEVTLKGQNIPLKCCQPLELLIYLERGFRSFNCKYRLCRSKG